MKRDVETLFDSLDEDDKRILAAVSFLAESPKSKRVKLGLRIEILLGERRGRPRKKDVSDPFSGHRTEDVVARFVGFGSGDNYQRAKKVVNSGLTDLIQDMDNDQIALAIAADLAKCLKSQ